MSKTPTIRASPRHCFTHSCERDDQTARARLPPLAQPDEEMRWMINRILQNANRSATQAGMIALAFLDFAAKVIKHVRSGHPLDDASLATLRDNCIRDLKNSTMIRNVSRGRGRNLQAGYRRRGKLLDGAIARATHSLVPERFAIPHNDDRHRNDSECIGLFSRHVPLTRLAPFGPSFALLLPSLIPHRLGRRDQ